MLFCYLESKVRWPETIPAITEKKNMISGQNIVNLLQFIKK